VPKNNYENGCQPERIPLEVLKDLSERFRPSLACQTAEPVSTSQIEIMFWLTKRMESLNNDRPTTTLPRTQSTTCGRKE
jgi:hypothetical protein